MAGVAPLTELTTYAMGIHTDCRGGVDMEAVQGEAPLQS